MQIWNAQWDVGVRAIDSRHARFATEESIFGRTEFDTSRGITDVKTTNR